VRLFARVRNKRKERVMKQSLGVCIIALLMLTTSCAWTRMDVSEGTEPGLRVKTPGTEARLNRVAFLTKRLGRRVAVESTGTERTATNTLVVYSVFRNRTEFEQKVQARTQYFGEQREPYEGPDAWQLIVLPPNGMQTYRSYSTGTDATYYYIEVMEMP